jgi:hypothetical protein
MYYTGCRNLGKATIGSRDVPIASEHELPRAGRCVRVQARAQGQGWVCVVWRSISCASVAALRLRVCVVAAAGSVAAGRRRVCVVVAINMSSQLPG